MAAKLSVGVAVVRLGSGRRVELLLVHPGGPFWANKDEHAWSIPKGEVEPDEEWEAAARREFAEETGQPVPDGPLTPLETFAISSGKKLQAYVVAGDLDATAITAETSNTFELEWPPRSGRRQAFPEVDRACWVDLDAAATKLHKGQVPLITQLERHLAETGW